MPNLLAFLRVRTRHVEPAEKLPSVILRMSDGDVLMSRDVYDTIISLLENAHRLDAEMWQIHVMPLVKRLKELNAPRNQDR